MKMLLKEVKRDLRKKMMICWEYI